LTSVGKRIETLYIAQHRQQAIQLMNAKLRKRAL
jgi:hypothetical protein